MFHNTSIRGWLLPAALGAFIGVYFPQDARAQAFISPSIGYNFGGSAGCRTATDCQNKNWNWGGSLGALGSVVGFEAELTYEGEFTGDRPNQRSSVTTLMGNFMLAPKITIFQPYGLAGIGLIRTDVEDRITNLSQAKNQVGWAIGGGMILFLQEHVGLKGDVRYYHAFQTLDLLGIDLARDQNKIDFGRAGFGVLFKLRRSGSVFTPTQPQPLIAKSWIRCGSKRSALSPSCVSESGLNSDLVHGFQLICVTGSSTIRGYSQVFTSLRAVGT